MRSFRKPQYEITIEEELQDMAGKGNVEHYEVMSEWQPVDSSYILEEVVARKHTKEAALLVLNSIAEGQKVQLDSDEDEFTIDEPDKHTEYMTWYVTEVTVED